MKAHSGLLGRRTQQPSNRRSRGGDYVMLSGAIAVALALAVLLATSHRMVHLGTAGGSRVKVRLKTWDQMDADFAAAEALASGKPGNIGNYFTGNRSAEGERLMRLAYPQYAARVDNSRDHTAAAELAESRGTQDEEDAQQDSEGAEAGGRQGEVDIQSNKRREAPVQATDARDAHQNEEISETAASQDSVNSEAVGDSARTQESHQGEATGDGRLSKGIWVIDLTDDEPALKDGEDTPMIKMWKELEEQRQRGELDPAKEAGSTILELEGSDPRVQRLQALGAQVRARFGKAGQMSASEDVAQIGLAGDAEEVKDSAAAATHGRGGDSASHSGAEVDVNTPLRLVTLFRHREVYKEPENPKLATWKQDLDRRLLELEEAAANRRKDLERERAHLFPHIPLIEGILEKALEPGSVVKDLFRPAAVEDLLDGAELEQRLQDEGSLEGILTDPELMPNWEVQLQMQQAA